MYFPALALGFAFGAIGLPFIAKAKTETDPTQQRNKRIVGILFLAVAAIFFLTFTISAVSK